MPTSSGDPTVLQALSSKTADMKRGCVVKSLSPEGSRKITISRYYNIAALEGLTKSQFNADISSYSIQFNSAVTTALTDEAGTSGDLMRKKIVRLHSALAPETAAAVTCEYRLTIDYYTLVWGKTTLPESVSTLA